MQLSLIFPPYKSPVLATMQQMHVNQVRMLLQTGRIRLISKKHIDLGIMRIQWTATEQVEIIEVTKKLNC